MKKLIPQIILLLDYLYLVLIFFYSLVIIEDIFLILNGLFYRIESPIQQLTAIFIWLLVTLFIVFINIREYRKDKKFGWGILVVIILFLAVLGYMLISSFMFMK